MALLLRHFRYTNGEFEMLGTFAMMCSIDADSTAQILITMQTLFWRYYKILTLGLYCIARAGLRYDPIPVEAACPHCPILAPPLYSSVLGGELHLQRSIRRVSSTYPSPQLQIALSASLQMSHGNGTSHGVLDQAFIFQLRLVRLSLVRLVRPV